MYFEAKVEFKDVEKQRELVNALFMEFNPKNSFKIQRSNAEVTIFFDDNPPKEIAKAICDCNIVYLQYLSPLNDAGDKVVTVKSKLEVSEETKDFADSKVSKETKDFADLKVSEETKVSEISKVPKELKVFPETANKMKQERMSIKELDNVAREAQSFEDFLHLIAHRLRISKKEGCFVSIAMIAAELDKLSWDAIQKEAICQRKKYSGYEKRSISCSIENGLLEKDIDLIRFLELLQGYKEFPFGAKTKLEPNENESIQLEREEPKGKVEDKQEETKSDSFEQVSKEPISEEIVSKELASEESSKIRLECMPVSEEFEDALASLDKTKTIEEQVSHVLKIMGLNQIPDRQRTWIVELMARNLRHTCSQIENGVNADMIPKEHRIEVLTMASTLVNDYIKKHGKKELVPLKVFLKQLRKVIINDAGSEVVI